MGCGARNAMDRIAVGKYDDEPGEILFTDLFSQSVLIRATSKIERKSIIRLLLLFVSPSLSQLSIQFE